MKSSRASTRSGAAGRWRPCCRDCSFSTFQPWTFVAVRGGIVAGFIAAFRSETDDRQVYCHFVGVDPAQRGQGSGEAPYRRLFADATAARCEQDLAATSPLNLGSIAFHKRLGFELIAGPQRLDGVPYFPDYDGPGEDRVRFRKALVVLGATPAPSTN
jgi:GNAT superfamily N-acetyltransferase